MEDMDSRSFNQFDVVSDVSEHHFLSSHLTKRKKDCFSNAYSSVYKTIMKEWRILQQNLPESIFVRAYENRIDLLRAAIVGAAGTPYHDGLFFFDIVFPRDYPSSPPRVHYHSFGYTINPYMASSGRLCLSLLNTASSNWYERWDPKQSTVFQVLLSIQSLVLKEKPYFDTPSQKLNQSVFILTCKSTILLIQKPPMNFATLVYGHFRERANAILMACEAYVNGRVIVGFHECNNGSGWSMVRVSRKFQTDMQELYPQLVAEFRRVGAPLENSVEHLRVEPIAKRKSDGVFKRLIGKITNFLRLKKKKNITGEKTEKVLEN